VREEPIEDRRRRGDVAQELPPVLGRSIRSDHCRCGFVPPDEDLEEVFSRGRAEPLHAEVLEHQEIDRRETLYEVAALAGGIGLGEVLGEIEGTPDEGVIAGANGADGDRDGRVRLPDAGWPSQQGAMMIADEARGGEVDEACPRDLRIERPVEPGEFLDLGDPRLFQSPGEEAVGSP
jgi:hypothetical protein